MDFKMLKLRLVHVFPIFSITNDYSDIPFVCTVDGSIRRDSVPKEAYGIHSKIHGKDREREKTTGKGMKKKYFYPC